MHCVHQCLQPVLDHAYSHHIPRLMVLANLALIAGVHPRAIGDWFYGMYVDAVDWVTTPNTIGMGMHADHAVVGTKPYCGSGKYVQRMSDYCKSCRYDVRKRTGDDACPFNVFYWDFLQRNEERFADNHRMAMILKNLARMSDDEKRQITTDAKRLRDELGVSRDPELR
jgi:deoxyribodipyrimidine photolyase-related protein